MLKALWFLTKISILIAAIGWVTHQPGTIEIHWRDYTLETSTSVLAGAAVLLIIIATIWDRIWRSFFAVPKVIRRYKESLDREKGYQSITKGLVAVAAGDKKSAAHHAKNAQKLFKAPTALTRLLLAQSSLMNGDNKTAIAEFNALLEDKDAAFFGIRGLLNEALKQDDVTQALNIIKQAEKLQPKQEWVLQTLFNFEVRARKWNNAEQTLSKAIKNGALYHEKGQQHRQALLLAQSDEAYSKGILHSALSFAKKAFKLNPGFTPAATRLTRLYDITHKRRNALKTIEKSWVKNPHPELAGLWMDYMPPVKGTTKTEQTLQAYKWYQRLHKINPHTTISQHFLGKYALDAQLWKEARDNLMSAKSYRLLARLEKEESFDDMKAAEWLELAADALPEPKWLCTECGHSSLSWNVECPHCSSFDSSEWKNPHTHAHPNPKLENMDQVFFEPPVIKTA